MKVSLSPFPKIPIPNWRFSYTGLSKIPYFKKYLKNLTISHAYLSTYSIGNYVSNVDYLENLGFQSALDFNQNFIPKNQI
ncbi:MAG TPA: hypothetical protein DF409_06530, partial [Bacteroidales bacterium]|nr:hypothetical protein [Bacteroidales bacterium]